MGKDWGGGGKRGCANPSALFFSEAQCVGKLSGLLVKCGHCLSILSTRRTCLGCVLLIVPISTVGNTL